MKKDKTQQKAKNLMDTKRGDLNTFIFFKSLKISPNFLEKRRKIILSFLMLVVLGFLLYLGKGIFIAATVGGKPISRLSVIRELEKRAGKQALDALITKELISQEAKKKNISVSDDEIKAQIDDLKKSIESQGSTLNAALAMQGQTMADLEENIKYQKMIEQILKDKTYVSEEEIKKYFEDNKSIYAKDAKFEDLKDDIRQKLTQEKLSNEFSAWLNNLKSSVTINYFVNY